MEQIYFNPADMIAACTALIPCMSRDIKTREYMNGVFIENHKADKQAFQLVASDGHTLGLARVNHADTLGDRPAPVFRGVLPAACVQFIAGLKPVKDGMIKLRIEVEEKKRDPMAESLGAWEAPPKRTVHVEAVLSAHNYQGAWEMVAESGTENGWIDYERVQPYEVIQPVAAFQTAFVGGIARAIEKAYKGGMRALSFGLSENAGSPMRIYTDIPGLQYIVMPVRVGETMREHFAPSLTPVEVLDRINNTLNGLSIGGVGSESRKLQIEVFKALKALRKCLRDEAFDEYMAQQEAKESEAGHAAV